MSGNSEGLLSDALITVVLICQSSKESLAAISRLLILLELQLPVGTR